MWPRKTMYIKSFDPYRRKDWLILSLLSIKARFISADDRMAVDSPSDTSSQTPGYRFASVFPLGHWDVDDGILRAPIRSGIQEAAFHFEKPKGNNFVVIIEHELNGGTPPFNLLWRSEIVNKPSNITLDTLMTHRRKEKDKRAGWSIRGNHNPPKVIKLLSEGEYGIVEFAAKVDESPGVLCLTVSVRPELEVGLW